MRLFAIGDTHLPSTRGKTWTASAGRGTRVRWPRPGTGWSRPTTWSSSPATSPGRPGPRRWRRTWRGSTHGPGRRCSSRATTTTGGATRRPSSAGCSSHTGPSSASCTTPRWRSAPTSSPARGCGRTPEAPPMPGGEMGDEPADTDYVEREARRLALLHRGCAQAAARAPRAHPRGGGALSAAVRQRDADRLLRTHRGLCAGGLRLRTPARRRASPPASTESTAACATCSPRATPPASGPCSFSTSPETRLPPPALPGPAALP